MINLLPEETKISVHREYFTRQLVILLVFVLILAVSSCILILSIYFSFRSGLASQLKIGKDNNNKPNEEFIRLKKEASDINGETKILSAGLIQINPTDILLKITRLKEPEIFIKQFAIEGDVNGYKVGILGSAKTRVSLLSFVNSLKSETHFIEIQSPISNLINEKNNDFNITFKVVNQTAEDKKNF